MTELAERSAVLAIEQQMLQMPQVEIQAKMHHAYKVAAREILIPKGTALTGRIHKFSNLNVMAYGDMSVRMEDGTVQRLTGYNLIVSPPGTKRIAYAHEDTLWITVHGTESTDVGAIQAEFTAETEQEYLAHCEILKLQGE